MKQGNTQTKPTPEAFHERLIVRYCAPFRVNSTFPEGWNERPLTGRDFLRFCKRQGIRVHRISLEGAGYYVTHNNAPNIFINSRLGGVERTYTAFHELAHHLLHCFDDWNRPGRVVPMLVEAKAFAACAVMPKPMLEGRTARELARLARVPLSVAEFRIEVNKRWNL